MTIGLRQVTLGLKQGSVDSPSRQVTTSMKARGYRLKEGVVGMR